MTITDKTRKILWSKSGSKCAICKCELLLSGDEVVGHVVLGEECHIHSKNEGGPRYDPISGSDNFENLLLLCPNHHLEVDKDSSKYSPEILRRIKNSHENWVREKLIVNKTEPEILGVLTSAKEIITILIGSHEFRFGNEKINNNNIRDAFGDFFQHLYDWADILPELGPKAILEAEKSIEDEMVSLGNLGYNIFGKRYQSNKIISGKTLVWHIAHIQIVHKDSSYIVEMANKAPSWTP